VGAHARGAAGAALRRLEGVAAAVFPAEPELRCRAFTVDTWTRATRMRLEDVVPSGPEADIVTAPWSDHLAHLRALGLPEALLSGTDPTAFPPAAGRRGPRLHDGEPPVDSDGRGVYAAVGFRDLGRCIEYVPLTRSG
jgi:hypothetical protein